VLDPASRAGVDPFAGSSARKIDNALQHADLEFQSTGKDEYWAWRFRTLKAHILIFRGSYHGPCSCLLELATALAHTDVAVRRKLIRAARTVTQRYNESLQDLTEAAQLAQSYQPELTGDVAQAAAIWRSIASAILKQSRLFR
jgi:hypothetical protein